MSANLSTAWNLSSRVHALHTFIFPKVACFVKRDDELACGISGTKLRKYSSLIPALLNQGVRHLVIIAGPQSNNLLAALQMAREHQLHVTAFLIQPKHEQIVGNFKLSRMFIKEEEIHWVSREAWHEVDKLAQNYLNSLSVPAFLLSEGASVYESMAGAMTLADDIVRNETELGLHFNHLFVDAGTGFAAIALIKRMAELNHRVIVHVLLLADTEEVFASKVKYWLEFEPQNYNCFYPSTAKAFGSVNQTIRNEIKRLAYDEGILADPIYSAKLFYESKRHIQMKGLEGNVLIIHSGGTLTMPGFNF